MPKKGNFILKIFIQRNEIEEEIWKEILESSVNQKALKKEIKLIMRNN